MKYFEKGVISHRAMLTPEEKQKFDAELYDLSFKLLSHFINNNPQSLDYRLDYAFRTASAFLVERDKIQRELSKLVK
jgi:hypothetical protein